MRETLLSVATANQLELIGFWVLVAGLAGEIAILFVHHRPRLHNSLTVICVVAIIAGVWLERFGAEENRAPRKRGTIGRLSLSAWRSRISGQRNGPRNPSSRGGRA
jgi:hypothetical protein